VSAALDLHLTAEQQRLYEDTRGLAAQALKPIADRGQPGRVNRPLVRALADHGLLARLFPATHAIDLCLIREALATACTEAETAFALQGLGAYPILQAGTATITDDWIPRVADGTAIAAFALTERGAGTDARAIELTAEPVGGRGYRLTGEKLWISNAPDADIYTVFARAPAGITAFAVPGDAEGLSGEHKTLLAPHAIGSLRFDGVYIPGDHVLGNPGEGFKVAMRTLDLFRPSVGAFDGQAARDRDRTRDGRCRGPVPRRPGARARPSARALVSRRAGPADLRGRERDSARDHRAGDVPRGRGTRPGARFGLGGSGRTSRSSPSRSSCRQIARPRQS